MLNGKKTIIGSLCLSIISAIFYADMLDGQLNWLKQEQYLGIAGVVAGLTGVAMRLGINGYNKPAETSEEMTDEQLKNAFVLVTKLHNERQHKHNNN